MSDDSDSEGNKAPQAHPLEPLLKRLAELCEFALNYAEARKDKALASARHVAVQVALACIAGVCAVAVLLTSLVLALTGLSQVVGKAMGGYPGVGEIVVGGGTILIVVAVAWLRLAVRKHVAQREAKQKYERRHRSQQSRFGEDVIQRASS